jgi:thiamine biosynthesis lipoprotein
MPNADRPASPLGRREFLALGVGAFVVGVPAVLARRRPQVVRRTVPVMGTIAEIAVVHGDAGRAHAAIDAAMEELRGVDRTMTRFSDVSDIGRANRLAAREPVVVTAATAAVVADALAWARASDGAFDPALGRACRVWDVGHRQAPPSDGEVRRLAGRGLYRAVEVGSWRGEPVVRFADRDVEIDLGGIAKGYGVDRAVDAIRGAGITQGIVCAGGDLYALGESERGAPWRIGIRSPHDPHQLAGELEISDAAVATSGDYHQFFEHGGRRYHHLLDPTTGAPRITAVRSVTVVAGSCATADAGATTVFGMTTAAADRVLRARDPRARVARLIAERA